MNRHYFLFVVLISVAVIGMAFVPPIAQDPDYHHFADQRALGGIPNAGDVLSNLPFVLVGLLGLLGIRRHNLRGGLLPLFTHYQIFFLGVLLTGFGSGYYHLHPSNHTLVWDRLPMTIAFMAFFAALVGEFMSLRAGRWLLWPLLILGVASVFYWHYTEQLGQGDLRPYVLVQFLPILLTPYILLAFSAPFSTTRHLWGLVFFYLLAKVFESTDEFWLALGELISGHSLKHLAAALATFFMYLALRNRRVVIAP